MATWSSAFLLSNLLHKLQIDTSHLRGQHQDDFSVVELGAGTGLTGLTCAVAWRTNVVLTDLPGIVPGLQINVDLNSDVLLANDATVSCGTLDWNSPSTLQLHNSNPISQSMSMSIETTNKFPFVISADTMYTEEHPRLLSQTIAKCLQRSLHARAVICYPMRVAYLDFIREFWEAMESLGLVAEQEGRQEIDLSDWDDERLHEWSIWKWKTL